MLLKKACTEISFISESLTSSPGCAFSLRARISVTFFSGQYYSEIELFSNSSVIRIVILVTVLCHCYHKFRNYLTA